MSKSVLVMDTPDSCSECFCQKGYTVYGYACGFANMINEDTHCRPNWCPLKPLPKYKSMEKPRVYECGKMYGWNRCIDEITGGNND